MPFAPAPRLFRTSAFRLALLYMALFGASVLVLLGFIYWSTLEVIDRQTAENIDSEIRGLAEQYRNEGLNGLVGVLSERSGPAGDRSNVYLLVDPARQRVTGNLAEWPQAAGDGGTWVDLTLQATDQGETTKHRVRARTFVLAGDYRLLVGRDTHEQARFRELVIEALAWSLAATALLGLAGGYLMSRQMLRRVDDISETARRIVRGDLSQRVPTVGSGDEFDRLAGRLNDMFDQIEQLMTGMRAVTDSLAHDLRSPLTRLKGRIELALRAKPDLATYRKSLDQAIADADAILATFNALVSVAMAEAGLGRAEMTRVDVAALAHDAAELYEPLAESKGLRFAYTAAGSAMARGHHQLLAQAVANLLDNAVKYTPAGGAVGLAVQGEKDRVRISVHDTGPGIAVADRERVLRRFVRLDASRRLPGSGLGLSLVAAVAKLHGATLELTDNAPGNTPGLRVNLSLSKDDAEAI